jgi:hypothetical protein
MSRITITDVRRRGWPDWAVGAVCLAALLIAGAAGFAGGVRYAGGIWTHTILFSASCRDYWRHAL